ncbi:ImmA/IrrE family metallo-endopeptidase [Curtobacterium sp. UCD-KPL2560]|uniref:ImmA/IrrE family metallo-endopeptidase n=1 Tax=Curtobacterium sp. UCD-KPL2560 TaxID=1885315 RepID=UPI000826048A|nr:ImmA/IrrE family metallo-endopeptidase [Curtobacterium sp. UCD-KPL2560]
MGRYDPYEHAAQLGIDVIHRPIRSANGFWYPDHNLIVIRSGMRAVHDRSALAHEIGHADLGHRDDRPKHEVQADRYAALHLIDDEEAAEICAWTQDPAKIAAELGVSGKLWRVWWNVRRQAGGDAGESVA